MKGHEARRIWKAQVEEILGRGLQASVEVTAPPKRRVPFEQISVERPVDLAVLAPRKRGGERVRLHRSVEFDRGRDPWNVVRLEPGGLVQDSARYLGHPRSALPFALHRPRI